MVREAIHEAMTITTAEIRRAFDVLLAECERRGSTTWHFTDDYYWDVPASDRYDTQQMDSRPELTIGQLSFDIDRVKSLASGRDEAIDQGLVWLAAILRYAGDQGFVTLPRL
jgi:hypothetical protein